MGVLGALTEAEVGIGNVLAQLAKVALRERRDGIRIGPSLLFYNVFSACSCVSHSWSSWVRMEQSSKAVFIPCPKKELGVRGISDHDHPSAVSRPSIECFGVGSQGVRILIRQVVKERNEVRIVVLECIRRATGLSRRAKLS